MRIIMTALFALAAVCALPGCEGEDPAGGEVEDCEFDPRVAITFPESWVSGPLAQVVDFEWAAASPCEIEMTRYLVMPVSEGDEMIAALNKTPADFESLWSGWRALEGHEGGHVRLESELTPGLPGTIPHTEGLHFFAVQAKASDGRVTAQFVDDVNARVFDCEYRYVGPRISLIETGLIGPLAHFIQYPFLPYLGAQPVLEIPGGYDLGFVVIADAEYYGHRVAGYRYGWDIPDPEDWGEPFTSENVIPEATFSGGSHYLTVEVIDDMGLTSSVTIRFDIVPMTMERDLLWVDDLVGLEVEDYMKRMPSEQEHDGFWEGLCSRCPGFDPAVDVYDVAENGGAPPPLALLARYKNLVWTYGNLSGPNAWRAILFRRSLGSPLNYLPMFMAGGGHIWTLGRSDRTFGGLDAVLPTGTLLPADLGCPELGWDCGLDLMPSRDYGVTGVDCVMGPFRTDEYMPFRDLGRDALRYIYLDDSDPVTLAMPGLPGQLELSEEVTCEVCFWNPYERGFYYAEVYDPYYWILIYNMVPSSGFHPMFRMRSRNVLSPLNGQAVALWISKYDDVVPIPVSGPAVAAPSAHMGFPLWFFDHDSAAMVADVIFGVWGIGP